jgi:Na+/melibiose symporter-like transporter
VPLFNLVWMALALKYRITREQHAAVRQELGQRRAASVAHLN